MTNLSSGCVVQSQVSIHPYSPTSFEIVYVPSSLSVAETATISLIHPDLGTWEYHASGVGELPGMMPQETPTSVVGHLNSHMFSFRNPFNVPIVVGAILSIDDVVVVSQEETETSSRDADSGSLQSDESLAERPTAKKTLNTLVDEEPVFKLLLKKTTGIVIPAFTGIQIPVSAAIARFELPCIQLILTSACSSPLQVSFYPKTITTRTGSIEMRGSYGGHELTWVYPIRGIAEAPKQHRAFTLKCKGNGIMLSHS